MPVGVGDEYLDITVGPRLRAGENRHLHFFEARNSGPGVVYQKGEMVRTAGPQVFGHEVASGARAGELQDQVDLRVARLEPGALERECRPRHLAHAEGLDVE